MELYRMTSEAHVYFLTYSVVEWLPVFVSEAACKILTDSLTFCHRQKDLRINAFVIMPTHMHLIVFDGGLDSKGHSSAARCRWGRIHAASRPTVGGYTSA